MAFLTACGTTYNVPELSNQQEADAQAIFNQERDLAFAASHPTKSSQASVAQFNNVIRRMEPAAEKFCRAHAVDRKGFDCNIEIVVDTKMSFANAYQTYAPDGTAIVAFTLPMIADARNEDEIAFVLGHEMGHHLAEHLKKQEQQRMAGALIAGMAMAAAGAYDTTTPDYYQQQNIQNAALAGAALGGKAYSQTYELESDVIGTYIAKSAGYDPVVGARFFARPESPKQSNGQLSFWGTHPPDEKRLATVIATVAAIEASSSQTLQAR